MIKCTYCGLKDGTYELKDWDNPNDIAYYCEDHIQLAKSFNREQEERFYEYYEDESRRSWLNERNQTLWKSIDAKKKHHFF